MSGDIYAPLRTGIRCAFLFSFYYNEIIEERATAEIITGIVWVLAGLFLAGLRWLFRGEKIAQEQESNNLVRVQGEVVAYKAHFEEISQKTNGLVLLGREVRNGYLVSYAPIVRFEFTGVVYEIEVDSLSYGKPRLNVPMDILVDVNNMKKAYDAAQTERDSFLSYFFMWLLVVAIICGVIIFLVRNSSLTI